MPYSLAALNQMDQAAFVAALGAVFEETPAIAHQAWHHRPFDSVPALHRAMVHVMQNLSSAEQIALIRAHPDLGSKAQMAEASVQEQAGVGLDRLSLAEYERFHALNQSYRATFGFPFIIAVKNHTKSSILAAFEQRLQNSPTAEQAQAIAEIAEIARFRLAALVTPTA